MEFLLHINPKKVKIGRDIDFRSTRIVTARRISKILGENWKINAENDKHVLFQNSSSFIGREKFRSSLKATENLFSLP